jgi:hypothetical protein
VACLWLFLVAQATQNADKKFSAARIKQVAKPCVKRFPGCRPISDQGLLTESDEPFLPAETA